MPAKAFSFSGFHKDTPFSHLIIVLISTSNWEATSDFETPLKCLSSLSNSHKVQCFFRRIHITQNKNIIFLLTIKDI
jgi:hypothetical protein